MYYTILVKSDCVGDIWKVHKVAGDKSEAGELALRAILDGHKRVVIKEHQKPISQLSNYDNFTATFSDGTVASLPEY